MNTKQILREYNYHPLKARSQNFLVDERILNQIAQLAHLGPEDTVVEIGAGPGNLTRRLARFAGKVYAVETEEELVLILNAENKRENIEVIKEDALELDYKRLYEEKGKLKLVANLPYHITTPLIFKLLHTPEIFSEMLLMVQEEVGNRLTARPGSRDWGILAISTQLFADTSIVLTVGPRAFMPRPKVNSVVVRLRMLPEPRAGINDREFFDRLVRAAFGMRRKNIKNALCKSPKLEIEAKDLRAALEDTGIPETVRPESLSIRQFADLSNNLMEKMEKNKN